MAPNFDNNLALVATGLNKKMASKNNALIADFIRLLKSNNKTYEIKSLTENDIIEILNDVWIGNNIKTIDTKEIEKIAKHIINNYNIIIENT